MIPDDMVKKAWRAYARNNNTQAIRNEFNHPNLRGPMPPPPDTRQSMRAALEAVAADIWDEGCEHGGRNGHSDSWRQDEEDPDLAHWPYDDNPYRNEHA